VSIGREKEKKLKKYSGLEKLVADHIRQLSEGIAYVAVGKRRPGSGGRLWDMIFIYPDSDSGWTFGMIRRLIREDDNTILFNTYQSAWAGFTEHGDYKSVEDVAKRIKEAYETGKCRATFDDVDVLEMKKGA
jgi:hypothetical protein